MIDLMDRGASAPDHRRKTALSLAGAALRAVDAESVTSRVLRTMDLPRRLFMLAFGKAAVPMARAALRACPDAYGFVVGASSFVHPGVTSFVGGHPWPCADAEEHGRAVWKEANALKEGDVALCLVSGGGSAMLELPARGHSLQEIKRVTRDALRRGVPIERLNVRRAELSAFKGGGLARLMQPAQIHNVLISDVPGSPPGVIASGATWTEGLSWTVAADNRTGQDALVDAGAALGLCLVRHEGVLRGEARETGARWMRSAARLLDERPEIDGVVGGGETTVTIQGRGCGGRNGELVLGAAGALGDHLLLSLASDGVDGFSESAGALLDAAGLRRGIDLNGRPEAALAQNNTAPWLRAAGLLLRSGPTETNVADLQLVLR